MPVNLKNYKPLFYACLATLILWIVVNILSANTYFAHHLYPKFYQSFYPIYAHLLGWVPFSIGDILYAILFLLLVWAMTLCIRCFLLGQRWRGIYILSRIVLWLGIFYVIFHLLWGFNYYKPPLTEIYDGSDYTVQELKTLSEELQSTAMILREKVEEDEQGVYRFDRRQYNQLKPHDLRRQELLYHKVPRKSQPKYSLYSWAMRYLGVAGYFNPFSGEAQIIRKIPSTSVPFSMAHEQAHQMGYASENEANFIGYLIGETSTSDALRYAANYKALKYVLREIYPVDSAFVKDKINHFSDGMHRDYEAEIRFNQKYSGKANEVFSHMNHLYLQANQQQDGIHSYHRFVELLVGYYRKNKVIKESALD